MEKGRRGTRCTSVLPNRIDCERCLAGSATQGTPSSGPRLPCRHQADDRDFLTTLRFAGKRSIGSALDTQRNSLNALRLTFALCVVLGHSAVLGGYDWSPGLGTAGVGVIAVDAFFAISGFLIAASAMRSTTVRFLWQRALRILPGFWVCLVAVAFGFGVVGWLHSHSSLSGYFSGNDGALSYVWQNAGLHIAHFDINASPAHVPFPLYWNNSLWTLEYEFACYLILGGLALCGLLRRRAVVLALFVVSWGLAAVHYWWLPNLTHGGNELRFIPIFMAGSVLYLYRDKVPDSKWLFAAVTVCWVIACFGHDSGDFAGPLLAYPCLWLGAHLPFASLGAKNDLSYGIYIYAYPVAQVLALWGINHWGPVPYLALTIAATVPLAALSWKLVEQPALRLKRWRPSLVTRQAPVPDAAIGG